MGANEPRPIVATLLSTDARYPAAIQACLGSDAPAAITALGDLALLDSHPLAIFCSARCPGSLIVQASDLAHALRDRGSAVIGGFHTPVERACLEILLAGAGPLIVCPARGMYRTIPAQLRKPLADGRLLLLSPFDEAERRITAELAAYRNRFVAALAESVLFVHAAPGGRTEALAKEVIEWGKPAYAMAHPANAHLTALGVRASVALKSAEAGFRQGWQEAMIGDTRPVSELWEGIDVAERTAGVSRTGSPDREGIR